MGFLRTHSNVTLAAILTLVGRCLLADEAVKVASVPPFPPSGALVDRLPLFFFEGEGGTSHRFVARGADYAICLTPEEVTVKAIPTAQVARFSQSHGAPESRIGSLRMRLLGARSGAEARLLEPHPGKIHDFRGASPREWRRGMSAFARLRFSEVYPGVDVEYFGKRGHLEYDFLLAPGVSPTGIRLRFEGATSMHVDPEGALVMDIGGVAVRQPRPYVFQDHPEGRRALAASFVLEDNGQVGFAVEDRDPSLPMVIDPAIVYAELLGGGEADQAFDVALDSEGAVYVVGVTESADLPVENATQSELQGGRDVFVMKLHPGEGSLDYITYLGGSDDDVGYAVSVDDAGAAYVVGSTRSFDFPTLAPLQTSLRGTTDAFIVKLDSEGLPQFSTFLGGDGLDMALDLDVDATGRVFLTGTTRSTNFPTVGAIQSSHAGSADVFVAVLDPLGSALDYSTYLGGSGFDQGLGLRLDVLGNLYLTGETHSADFPTVGPWQPALGGEGDAFVAQIGVKGDLRFSTYLGGSRLDQGHGIAIGEAGRIFVTGTTQSSDFPTLRPIQSSLAGGFDVFLTALDVMNRTVVFSTFLGGGAADIGYAVAVDHSSVYVAGHTGSFDFPGLAGKTSPCGDGLDGFLIRLDSWGREALDTACIGGTGRDVAMGLAVGASGSSHVAGATNSQDFLTWGGAPPAGGSDAFVLGEDLSLADLELRVEKRHGRGLEVVVSNRGPDRAQRVELVVLGEGLSGVPVPNQGRCWVSSTAMVCDLEDLPQEQETTVELPAKLRSGFARVRALTVDPALHDNALPLDSKSGRPVFLKVIRGGKGSGLVKSLPAGIHCGSDCLEKYGSAAELVLVAEPGPGSRFAGWNGACRGTGTCNLSVDAPTTVRAVFEPADEGHGKVHNPGTHPSRRQGAQP